MGAKHLKRTSRGRETSAGTCLDARLVCSPPSMGRAATSGGCCPGIQGTEREPASVTVTDSLDSTINRDEIHCRPATGLLSQTANDKQHKIKISSRIQPTLLLLQHIRCCPITDSKKTHPFGRRDLCSGLQALTSTPRTESAHFGPQHKSAEVLERTGSRVEHPLQHASA